MNIPKMMGIIALKIILSLSFAVQANDEIRLSRPHSALDKRDMFSNAALNLALERTVHSHGPYHINTMNQSMNRDRALVELIRGKLINVHIVPTKPSWEDKTLAIKFPLMKGLLGYRLLLIRQQDIPKFSALKDMEALKQLRAGLGMQWSTTAAMKHHGFNVVTGSAYEGLFGMLMLKRFDYFPRGVNEVFAELDSRKHIHPDMVIAPEVMMYLPLPYYIFVSPKNPRLAERLEAGLYAALEDGSFDAKFHDYFGDIIKTSNIKNRRMFYVENPFLTLPPQSEQPELWLAP